MSSYRHADANEWRCRLGISAYVAYAIGPTADFLSSAVDTAEVRHDAGVLAKLLRNARFSSLALGSPVRVSYSGSGRMLLHLEEARIPVVPSADSPYDLMQANRGGSVPGPSAAADPASPAFPISLATRKPA